MWQFGPRGTPRAGVVFPLPPISPCYSGFVVLLHGFLFRRGMGPGSTIIAVRAVPWWSGGVWGCRFICGCFAPGGGVVLAVWRRWKSGPIFRFFSSRYSRDPFVHSVARLLCQPVDIRASFLFRRRRFNNPGKRPLINQSVGGSPGMLLLALLLLLRLLLLVVLVLHLHARPESLAAEARRPLLGAATLTIR